MNILKFYTDISEVQLQSRKSLLLSPSNKLTAFFLDISSFSANDLDSLDITLKGCTDINLKDIAGTGDLYVSGNYLYFKNTKSLTQLIEGVYYLEITDDVSTFYSNKIFFSGQYTQVVSGDYLNLYIEATGYFEMTLSGTGDITIDWGDGNQETVTISSETVVSHTYTSGTYIAKVYGGQNITSFTCNESELTKIDNTENFTNLETLDISDTSMSSFYFFDITTLESITTTNTSITDYSGISRSNLEFVEANNVGIQDADTQIFSNFGWDTITELYLSNNNISTIRSTTQAANYYTALEILDLSYNQISTIPLAGLNGSFELNAPISEWIVSNNDIRVGTTSQLNYLKPFLGGVTDKIDMKNNALSQVDSILTEIADNNSNLDGLYVDISGASPISGISSDVPRDNIVYTNIIHGGSGYEVGDVFTIYGSGSVAILVVEEINEFGGITELSIFTGGSGYNEVELLGNGGSGSDALVELYSPRVYLEDNGVELYTNATEEVELRPENALVSSDCSYFLKNENGDYLTWQ